MAEPKPMLYQGRKPIRGYEDDAGLDLTVAQTTTIPPGKIAWIDLDCRVKAPHGYWLMLTGRSSAIMKRRLLVFQGIIDPGYVGPLFAGCLNLDESPVTIEAGERVAQLIVFVNHTADIELVEVQNMPATARGSNGFGSTGR